MTAIITEVTAWDNSKRDNQYLLFTGNDSFSNKTITIPIEILNKILTHLNIKSYRDTIVLHGVKSDEDEYSSEEIWSGIKFAESVEVLASNLSVNNFSWGHLELGYLTLRNVNGELIKVPTFWTQNASPIGFAISEEYIELVKSISNIY